MGVMRQDREKKFSRTCSLFLFLAWNSGAVREWPRRYASPSTISRWDGIHVALNTTRALRLRRAA